jgi:hypothetical protein
MDRPLQHGLAELVREFAERHQAQLDAAGTLVSLEELTAQIGDSVARELANQQLRRRSAAVSDAPLHSCPECGAACVVEPDPEPVILRGIRGELEYTEPRCHCPRCRRDFFPAGRTSRTARP